MKHQVASLTLLHHTMLNTSFRIKKSWREGLVTTTPPSSPMRQRDRAAAGHAKLPFSVMLSEDDSHTELSCHLSFQGLQSHLRASWKVLMSHQTTWKEILPHTGYQPSVSSSLLPSAEVLFHTSPGWERGFPLWRGRTNVWEVQVLVCRKCTSIHFCTGQSACCLTKIYPIEDSPSPLRHKELDINSQSLKTVRGKRKLVQHGKCHRQTYRESTKIWFNDIFSSNFPFPLWKNSPVHVGKPHSSPITIPADAPLWSEAEGSNIFRVTNNVFCLLCVLAQVRDFNHLYSRNIKKHKIYQVI